ncbi:GNAT family N-acetyltransferase [Limnoglobus roseus]|uniref:GNAT family N-acetyltransferase n=1 Tax=Limnoglobus roseus TaxID=2598579 RepID=A0A5C1AK06_9BACT|nr:GNAT family N-acetyltransferase [Limnoglobus roseus]QEL19729.1 GNAT family N-acetyltransferase [Limnoglobus roseus]
MIVYRAYRNTDPPGLADVWNEAAIGRGAIPIRNPSLFERWMFSKPYFEAPALVVAEEVADNGDKKIIGFALSAFAPTEEQNRLDYAHGIVCCVLVRPTHQHKGIGSELLRRAEAYLTERGATAIAFGSQWPKNPHLFGLYGGSNSPGVLDSDPAAKAFLAKSGYQPAESVIVFQRSLDQPFAVVDTRLPMLRRRYDVQLLKAAAIGSWWQECLWNTLEPAEFRVIDKLTGMPAARAIAWELEGFGWRWNAPSAGIIDVQVRPDLRRQGVGKMLVSHILKFLQDQFFGIVELQVRADDPAAVGMCKSLGFEQVDAGYVYRK